MFVYVSMYMLVFILMYKLSQVGLDASKMLL